jgi:tetratricopeptide (TPR) repeat protein
LDKVKVGFSLNDPELRAKGFNTATPEDNVVEYVALVNNPKEIEKKAHILLKHCRYREVREFFICDVITAAIAIRQAAKGFIIHEDSKNTTIKEIEAAEIKIERKKREDKAASYIKKGDECDFIEDAIKAFKMASEFYQELDNKKGISEAYSKLSDTYWDYKKDSKLATIEMLYKAIEFRKKTLAIFEELGNKSEIIEQNEIMASIYVDVSEIYKSLDEYDKAIEIMEKGLGFLLNECELTGDGFNIDVAITYSKLGSLYSKIHKFNDAIKMYEKSLQIHEDILAEQLMYNDKAVDTIAIVKKLIASNCQELGKLYPCLGKKDKAIEVYQKALKICEELADKKSVAIIYSCLGEVDSFGNCDNAIEMHQKSLQIHIELGDKEGMTNDYTALGAIYEQGNEALEMFQKSLQIHEDLHCREGIASDCYFLGNIFAERGEYNKAIEMRQKALQMNQALYDDR